MVWLTTLFCIPPSERNGKILFFYGSNYKIFKHVIFPSNLWVPFSYFVIVCALYNNGTFPAIANISVQGVWNDFHQNHDGPEGS